MTRMTKIIIITIIIIITGMNMCQNQSKKVKEAR